MRLGHGAFERWIMRQWKRLGIRQRWIDKTILDIKKESAAAAAEATAAAAAAAPAAAEMLNKPKRKKMQGKFVYLEGLTCC